MWVTLYTDASFHQEQGSGWACWLRSELGRDITKGRCPPSIIDANMAEMHAILEGILRARAIWPSTSGIHVKTDSQTAIDVLRYRARTPRRSDYAKLQRAVQDALAPNILIKMRWTPGHQTSSDTPAYLNNRVDEFARAARRSK